MNPDFCKKKWCYVDLSCTAPDTVASTINREIGYSYMACGDMVAGGVDVTSEFIEEPVEQDCKQILADRAAAEAARLASANSLLNVPQSAVIMVGDGMNAQNLQIEFAL